MKKTLLVFLVMTVCLFVTACVEEGSEEGRPVHAEKKTRFIGKGSTHVSIVTDTETGCKYLIHSYYGGAGGMGGQQSS